MAAQRLAAAVLCLSALSCAGQSPTATSPSPSPSVDTARGALQLHATTGMVSGEECLTAVGSQVYFRAESAEAGSELWRTDGTLAGTRLALDVVPGTEGSRPGCASLVGGRLFFSATTRQEGRDFWTSDGTAAGTVALDLSPGVRSAAVNEFGPPDRALAGDRLFFLADDGVHGPELWATDGTAPGTAMVADLRPGPLGSYPSGLHAVGAHAFFSADDGVHGRELWTSDGTAAGTHLVADAFPGGEDSNAYVKGATDELVFFSALWRRIGSEYSGALFSVGPRRGIVRVLEATGSSGGPLGGRYLFLRSDGSDDGLWASDGTPAGTALVAPVRNWQEPVFAAGRVFFVGFDADHGYELWASDGAARGTRMVRDIIPGPESSFPWMLTSLGDLVAFEGRDGNNSEPWLSDGTSEGTRMAAFLGPTAAPRAFTRAGGRIYCVSTAQLWVLTGSLD